MAKISPFHSVNEPDKSSAKRVYHNNNTCPSGHDIPKGERRQGTDNYRVCKHCKNRN